MSRQEPRGEGLCVAYLPQLVQDSSGEMMKSTVRVLIGVVVMSGSLVTGSAQRAMAQFAEEGPDETAPEMERPRPREREAVVVPSVDPAVLERLELRVKRARIGLLSTTGLLAVGMALTIAVGLRAPSAETGLNPVLIAGFSLTGAGLLGMITSGGILGHRAKELRRVKPLHPSLKWPRVGIYVSTGVFFVGGVVLAFAGAATNTFTGEGLGVLWAGVALASAGLLGMVVSGTVLGVRKRKLRELEGTSSQRPRRAHWDLATSRLVF